METGLEALAKNPPFLKANKISRIGKRHEKR